MDEGIEQFGVFFGFYAKNCIYGLIPRSIGRHGAQQIGNSQITFYRVRFSKTADLDAKKHPGDQTSDFPSSFTYTFKL